MEATSNELLLNLKVKVVEYHGEIIIETLKPDKDEYFIPVTEPGHVGSVLTNTGRFLGMSKEAWALIKSLKKSHDDLGEVTAWKAGDKDCFGWLGPIGRRVGPEATVDRGGIQDIDFVTIPNILNPEIKDIIDCNDLKKANK